MPIHTYPAEGPLNTKVEATSTGDWCHLCGDVSKKPLVAISSKFCEFTRICSECVAFMNACIAHRSVYNTSITEAEERQSRLDNEYPTDHLSGK